MKKVDRVMLAIYFLLVIGYVYVNFASVGTNSISHIFVWVTVAVLARMLFLLWNKQKTKKILLINKHEKNIISRVLFGIGAVLLVCYVGGLVYFNYFAHYSPYASAGANVDSFIHSVLFLPASILCLLLSLILHIKSRK